MPVVKNKLSRRDFVKQFGLAAGIAMPFFRSQVAMGQTSTGPVRVLFVALQHGWGSDRAVSRFTGSGSNFTAPAPFDAFNSIRNQCVFVDGLRTGYWGNAHDVSYQDILTCSVPANENGSTELGGVFPMPTSPSIDWMIGNAMQKNVLRLNGGYTSWGAAHHHLSFDASLRSLPFFTNARSAYMSVIDPLRQQQGTPPPNPNVGSNALLSMLGKDADRLVASLSGTERTKMEGYISSLAALGQRIIVPESTTPVNIQLPNLPGMSISFNDQIDSYLDMIRIAFTLDTHRVAVLGLGQGVNNWSWTDQSGANRMGYQTPGSDFHQQVAHHGSRVDSRLAYEGWVRWYAQKVVGFVNALQQTQDVGGRSLLDNTIIVLTGEVGSGEHDRHNIVHTVIGGGGNRINRGRLIQTAQVEPRNRQGFFWGSRTRSGALDECGVNYGPPVSAQHAADLWVSVARLAGLNINRFGFDVYNSQPIQL